MVLVKLEGVKKEYRLGESRIPAIRGVDLVIREREFVAVWGPSGSGKSTLCNLVGTLDVPTAGRVLLGGRDVGDLSDDQAADFRNRTLGFIFQSFNLVPVLSALENVMLPLQIPGMPAAKARERAAAQLEGLGLGGHLAHRPDKLSGGQRQRVAIARALVTEPALVIADEPTANLDSDTAMEILDLLQNANFRWGTTFLVSTHDQRLLTRIPRRILLRDGRIVEDTGAPAAGGRG